MASNSVTAALAAVRLEVAPALFNTNFDFTLVKFVPPSEYQGVGTALSHPRREHAEAGKLHVLARKLDALFDKDVPETPILYKAYGERASEIACTLVMDDASRRKYGPFANQVGIDATSLWAAATSGKRAIGVHLLACMLARIWPSSEATAIWVEIIENKKAKILQQLESENEIETKAYVAAKQEFDREAIREWDASTRAWLQSADQAMVAKQTQLMLIIDNLDKPINQLSTTYDSVITAWKNSLMQMETLVKGTGITASQGDILLALSSWHLYPNLSLLTPRVQDIDFKDRLIPSGGVLTIGMKPSDDASQGIYWSLPLNHLRRYGEPVVARRSVAIASSKVSLDQFKCAFLGAALRCWGHLQPDKPVLLHWMTSLLEYIETCPHSERLLGTADAGFSWLQIILSAAKSYVNTTGSERNLASRLLALGHEHGLEFLGSEAPRMLGDFEYANFVKYLRDQDDRINALRDIAEHISRLIDVDTSRFIIRDSIHDGMDEFASALPLPTGGKRKRHDIASGRHWRVLHTGRLACREGTVESTSDVYHLRKVPDQILGQHSLRFISRKEAYMARGEDIYTRDQLKVDMKVLWNIPFLRIVSETGEFVTSKSYLLLCGSDSHAGLYYESTDREEIIRIQRCLVTFSSALQSHLEAGVMDLQMVTESLEALYKQDTYDYVGMAAVASMVQLYRSFPNAFIDLKVLDTRVFEAKWFSHALSHQRLDRPWSVQITSQRSQIRRKKHATVSKVEALLMDLGPQSHLSAIYLDKAAAFACILLFESGIHNTHADLFDRVLAISTNDSLFVSGTLLHDPSDRYPRRTIQHITGNVGKPGAVLLIPPLQPMIRKVGFSDWRQMPMFETGSAVEKGLENSSLHISFTGTNEGIGIAFTGSQDLEVSRAETLVRLFQDGNWVGDLDIDTSLRGPRLERLNKCSCSEELRDGAGSLEGLMRIDSWVGLIAARRGHISLVSTKKDWQVRMAATVLSVALGYWTCIFPGALCWRCISTWTALNALSHENAVVVVIA